MTKELKKRIDKILKVYLARTIAVNQFGLRNELLELLAQENKETIKIVEGYFYEIQSRIPFPDPITMRDEIVKKLKRIK